MKLGRVLLIGLCAILLCAAVAALLALRLGRPLYYSDGGGTVAAHQVRDASVLVWSTPKIAFEIDGQIRGRICKLPDGRWLFGLSRSKARTDLVLFDPKVPELAPEPVLALNTTGHELAPSLGPDMSLYFASDRGGDFDIYRAQYVGGRFLAVERLPESVNTLANESDPEAARLGQQLLFSRNDPNSGATRLWQTDLADATTAPTLLFPDVLGNDVTERDPSFDGNGRQLLFVRETAGRRQLLRCPTHRGELQPPLQVDLRGSLDPQTVRSPILDRKDLSLHVVQPGKTTRVLQLPADELTPYWAGQAWLEKALWMLAGVAALFLVLLTLGARWHRLDLITKLLLLSLVAHLLLLLWLSSAEITRRFVPSDREGDAVEVLLLSRVDAPAAQNPNAAVQQRDNDISRRLNYRQRQQELQEQTPRSELADPPNEVATPQRTAHTETATALHQQDHSIARDLNDKTKATATRTARQTQEQLDARRLNALQGDQSTETTQRQAMTPATSVTADVPAAAAPSVKTSPRAKEAWTALRRDAPKPPSNTATQTATLNDQASATVTRTGKTTSTARLQPNRQIVDRTARSETTPLQPQRPKTIAGNRLPEEAPPTTPMLVASPNQRAVGATADHVPRANRTKVPAITLRETTTVPQRLARSPSQATPTPKQIASAASPRNTGPSPTRRAVAAQRREAPGQRNLPELPKPTLPQAPRSTKVDNQDPVHRQQRAKVLRPTVALADPVAPHRAAPVTRTARKPSSSPQPMVNNPLAAATPRTSLPAPRVRPRAGTSQGTEAVAPGSDLQVQRRTRTTNDAARPITMARQFMVDTSVRDQHTNTTPQPSQPVAQTKSKRQQQPAGIATAPPTTGKTSTHRRRRQSQGLITPLPERDLLPNAPRSRPGPVASQHRPNQPRPRRPSRIGDVLQDTLTTKVQSVAATPPPPTATPGLFATRVPGPIASQIQAHRRSSRPGSRHLIEELPGSFLQQAPRRKTRPVLIADAAKPDGSIYRNRFGKHKQAALRKFGGGEDTERAVRQGLAYLAQMQRPNGSWGRRRVIERKYGHVYIGKTALCLLAFLGAGHTPTSSTKYSDNAKRAVAFLLNMQDSETGHFGRTSSYGHGIATYALAECYALTKQKELFEPLEFAVLWTLLNQNEGRDRRSRGGWGYFSPKLPAEDGFSRASTTAWQVMAIESARRSGIKIPDTCLPAARTFLRRLFDNRRGYFLYNREPDRLRSRWRTLPASTPASVFCLLLLGDDANQDANLQRALRYTVDRRPRRYARHSEDDFVLRGAGNVYFWYYSTLACFMAGGETWKRWNQALKPLLLRAQQPDGSFRPIDVYAKYAGDSNKDRSYTTAMCVLSLEVYYRYFTPLLKKR